MAVAEPRDGFTLIELIVVIVLMGISAALVAPTISHSVERAQFRKDIGLVSAMLTLARSQAIAHKIPYALSIDIDKRRVWVDKARERNTEPDENIKQSRLSHIDRLRVDTEKGEKTSGIETLLFYPNGSSGGGTIVMGHRAQEATVEIHVNIVTGLASTTRPSK